MKKWNESYSGGKRISRWRKVKDSKRRDETSIMMRGIHFLIQLSQHFTKEARERAANRKNLRAISAKRLLVSQKAESNFRDSLFSPNFCGRDLP